MTVTSLNYTLVIAVKTFDILPFAADPKSETLSPIYSLNPTVSPRTPNPNPEPHILNPELETRPEGEALSPKP